MSIIYTYEIIKVDEVARCMEVVYTAEGHPTMHIGTRLPFADETLESVVRQYEPIRYWVEQQRGISVPTVGEAGTLNPVIVAPPDGPPLSARTLSKVQDAKFMAIFPTLASGSIETTIFE